MYLYTLCASAHINSVGTSKCRASAIVVVVVVVNVATVIESEADNVFECIWYSLRWLATLLLVSRSGSHAANVYSVAIISWRGSSHFGVWLHNVHIDRKPKWIWQSKLHKCSVCWSVFRFNYFRFFISFIFSLLRSCGSRSDMVWLST